MKSALFSWWSTLDVWVAACLFPAALAILISGLDDLVVVAAWVWGQARQRLLTQQDGRVRRMPGGERRIAIFVPLWHEHGVIAGMVEHNVAAIRYGNYHFFIGAYPNDEPTLDAVRELEERFSHVHLAVCPHAGPTSKADCLNWIYQSMLLFEDHSGGHFEIVVTHDAEDLIHPEALAKINAYADEFDMVQVPVLPLPTPWWDWVHGIYCDEFAEWQIKDMRVRQMMGSFVPSSGVGTGFTRAALEKLASAEHNLIFEPACLTEDYENGLRVHRLGGRQIFVPLAPSRQGMVATREFFPRTLRSAIRQRTRWVTGIGLQCWERHGWRGSAAEVYWFWRDRKGLIGNPLSLFANFLFLYGSLTWLGAQLAGMPWRFAKDALHPALLAATLAIQIIQSSVRMGCVGRLYGAKFALGVLPRAVFGNIINSLATLRAVKVYLRARIRHEPLVWVKTDHAYPSRSALVDQKRRLGEILVGSAYVGEAELEQALETQPAGVRLGDYLVELGRISEEELYEALSLQQSLPAGRLEPWLISRNVARLLPRQVARQRRVLPFRVASGNLFLASPEIPSDELSTALQRFTRLSLRFHLVTPQNFEELAARLL